MSRVKDLSGQKFGRLLVKSFAGSDSGRNAMWMVVCDCGVEKVARGFSLSNGTVASCGCSREVPRTHGMSHTSEYKAWLAMWDRCSRVGAKQHEQYVERMPPERWKSFENFFSDMGVKPTRAHTLERLDNEKGYGPENCKWATRKEQNNNRSNTVFVTVENKQIPLAEFAKASGVPYRTALQRFHKGKTAEQIGKKGKLHE